MSRKLMLIFSLLPFWGCKAQIPENRPEVRETAFDSELSSLLSFSVPLLGVKELRDSKGKYIILDAREREEYDVSHIPGAIFLGYNDYDKALLEGLDNNKPVLLYCSVGYRSEKLGEKLQKMGFTNVYNLYGSIFEWANQGYELETNSGQATNKIHTYNKKWSKWVQNSEFEKVW
ncbi:MAG: rhodanese-like domain-containing protein [Saprospiraceae bacterium]|nr:rhodanese-like domain-containing protein [Saprospiraceae bacterium]